MTDIVELMQTNLEKTDDPFAVFALDIGITEIERLREQLKYSNDFREIMNVERCDALEENERLREALKECSADFVTKSSDHRIAAQEILDEFERRALLARAALKEKE